MNIPIRIQASPDLGGSVPVSFGVPFAKGSITSTGRWSLAGRPVAATALDRWSDGSIRWALVDATVDVNHASSGTVYLSTDEIADAPMARMKVTENAAGITVDTGVLRATLRVGGSFPIDAVAVGGHETVDVITSDVTLIDATDAAVPVTVLAVEIECSSELRVSIRVDGNAVVSGKTLAVIARVDLYAGSPVLRVRCTIRNGDRASHPGNFWDLGDSGSALIKDCCLSLSWRGGLQSRRTALSLDVGLPLREMPLALELYQDSSGGENWRSTNHINRLRQVPLAFRGYRLSVDGNIESGLRATPALAAQAEGAVIGVTVPDFWQNFPRALEADTRAVRVRFFPKQSADFHELQGGEQKTHECFVVLGATLDPRDLAWTRSPVTVAVAPEWAFASSAVDGLAELEPGHRILVDQAIEGADSFEHKRELIDQFGWRHFGEIYGDHEAIGHTGATPLVSHYNNQYDPIAGFALQYLRTGDARWRRAMDELAVHVIDIDIYHTDRDKSAYNGGLFWHTYHYGDADTSTHRTYPKRNNGKVFGGGPSADHNYPSGLMLRYFLTGDVMSREAAIGLAEYVLRLDDGTLSPFRFLSRADTGNAFFTPPDYYGPSRSSGNSLNALVDGHRLTGDRRFLAKAEQLIRRAAHPAEDPGRNRLDEPEFRWFYAMFLQSLGKYLSHRAELGLIDDAYAYAQATLLNYARWMAKHEYPYLEKPEKLEFPTETWAAQDIRKSDIFCHAAMHAEGDERQRFLERAAFFHGTSIRTLSAKPTRALARPVIVLLTSGQWLAWMQSRRDATLPAGRSGVDFGAPVKFVGQRRIAEGRAKIIAATGVVAAMAALAVLVTWLF